MSSPETPEDPDIEVSIQENGADDASPSPSKKRKRDLTQTADELEVDLSLPEPPSKKALRKAKQQKNSTPRNETVQDSQTSDLTTDRTTSPPGSSKKDTLTKSATTTYGIWIGNLPFNTTKPMLRTFLISAVLASAPGLPPIPEDAITRIHIPAPKKAPPTSKARLQPQNQGFAYVDFSTDAALATALSLSETSFGGRNVLIKSAKDFKGRPEKTSATADAVAGTTTARGEDSKNGRATDMDGKKTPLPTRRVFVGNLGFDVTREDLENHFGVCGPVEHVFMATFEDTGKCKGFAWVSFEDVEAATSAVRGWAYVGAKPDDEDEPQEDDLEENRNDETDDTAKHAENSSDQKYSVKKKSKPRKWFVNRLQGRPLRCEFAEDASTRYKKRFGKEKENSAASSEPYRPPQAKNGSSQENDMEPHAPRDRRRLGITPGAPTDASKRRGHTAKQRKTDDQSDYRTGAIPQVLPGKKLTFE